MQVSYGGRAFFPAVLRTAMLALVLALGVLSTPATAATPEPATCRIGAYFMSIQKVDTAAGTFDATFWMWSLCPNRELEPLKTMQFLNGQAVDGTLDATLQRGSSWWSTRLFTGTFRQDFDLTNYPFDRQTLGIQIEEAVLDERSLRYTADSAASGMESTLKAPGWSLSGFSLTPTVTTRNTTFGDPSLPGGKSGYASMNIQVQAGRAPSANFIKATFPLYIAAFLALVSLGFDVVATDLFLGRMGALGTILFAVVLSFVSVDQLVGPHQGLYFLDQIHFAVLAVILVATAWSIFAHRASGRWLVEDVVQRWDVRVSFGLLVLYLAANAVMIIEAMRNA